MDKIPISLCLFSSTKGHFDIKTRYLDTVKSLNQQLLISSFNLPIANIKYEEENDILWWMKEELKNYGFIVNLAKGEKWSHSNQSHQSGYLEDMWNIFSKPEVLKNPYIFLCEDDWLFNIKDKNLGYWFNYATKLLAEIPGMNQVRFARFENEHERINNLQKKHNLDRSAQWVDPNYFLCDDFSCNPSIFRSRDLFLALSLMKNNPNSFVPHVEHGLGFAMKVLAGYNNRLSFAVLNPQKISVRHIGCPDKDIDPETGIWAEIV